MNSNVTWKINNTEQRRICSLYKNKKSMYEIARRFKISVQGVRYILKKHSIKSREISEAKQKYTLNDEFFDEINTEEKAYFLGLMYADGYNGEKKHRVCIALQERDIDILKKFKKCIKTNRPFYLETKRKPSHQNHIFFEIVNKRLSKALSDLGCVQGKSLKLKFPSYKQVPNKLLRHFIRGYFDGDGCLGIYGKNKYPALYFCGTKHFLNGIEKIWKGKALFRWTHPNKIYVLNVKGRKSIVKILRWMYYKSSISLNRKRGIFKKLCLC